MLFSTRRYIYSSDRDRATAPSPLSGIYYERRSLAASLGAKQKRDAAALARADRAEVKENAKTKEEEPPAPPTRRRLIKVYLPKARLQKTRDEAGA